MNASATVWRAWAQQVKALLPGVHGHRSKTLALFVFGVICAGSLRLPKIAESLLAISAAKAPSLERRLARFLANEQINARQVWTQFLAPLLKGWQEPRVVLLLDCTPIAAHSTVVYLGVLAHSRVLPLAWQVMPGQTSWDQGLWAVVTTLMEQVTPHLPQGYVKVPKEERREAFQTRMGEPNTPRKRGMLLSLTLPRLVSRSNRRRLMSCPSIVPLSR